MTTASPWTVPIAATPSRITAPRNDFQALIRPYVLIVIVAFNIGFLGYLLIGKLQAASIPDPPPPAAFATPADAPAPAEWNAPTPV